MKVTGRYLIAVALLALPLILSHGALVHYGWERMTEKGQVAVTGLFALAWFLFAGGATHLWRRWVTPVKRLANEADVVALSHAGHTFEIDGGEELDRAGRRLMELGAQLAGVDERVEREVEKRLTETAHEREGLAEALAGAGAGVMVVNRDGLVILANPLAEAHLSSGGSVVGRSLMALMPDAPVAESMSRCAATGSPIPFPHGAGEGAMTPFHRKGVHEGYIVTLWVATTAMTPPPSRGARPAFFDFSLMARTVDRALLDTPLAEATIVSFDTETTGLAPAHGDRIVSLGGVRIRNGVVRGGEVYETLVNPARPIPADATAIHHLTDDMVADAPLIGAVLPTFFAFVGDTPLLGHNLPFDLAFLKRAAEEAGGVIPSLPTLDTLLLSVVLHDHHDDHNLAVVARRLGVPAVGLHTALGDALTTAAVFLKLLPLLADRGVTTIGEALAFQEKATVVRREQERF